MTHLTRLDPPTQLENHPVSRIKAQARAQQTGKPTSKASRTSWAHSKFLSPQNHYHQPPMLFSVPTSTMPSSPSSLTSPTLPLTHPFCSPSPSSARFSSHSHSSSHYARPCSS